MKLRYARALFVALTPVTLTGCAATQVQENTLEMVDSVAHVREVQVLRNLSAAISDHDMVPTEILLSVGQATVASGASPSVKFPKFSTSAATREFDLGVSDTWTAQWQVTPVTNADDLRRLRNLYVLIVSTDAQYDTLEAYYTRHPEMRAPLECYGLQSPSSGAPDASRLVNPHSGGTSGDQHQAVPTTNSLCPAGYGSGVIPKWKQGLQIIQAGDSIGCKLYQETTLDARRKAPKGSVKGIPFKRWLYWRAPGGDWLPDAPEIAPESLGTFGRWELGTTSRACFNDFVLLVQSASPDAANASGQGARLMLNSQ